MLPHITQWHHVLGILLCIQPPVRHFGVWPGASCYSVACCAGNALCAFNFYMRCSFGHDLHTSDHLLIVLFRFNMQPKDTSKLPVFLIFFPEQQFTENYLGPLQSAPYILHRSF